jgi:hypothetical protein
MIDASKTPPKSQILFWQRVFSLLHIWDIQKFFRKISKSILSFSQNLVRKNGSITFAQLNRQPTRESDAFF